jgi:hypothetical protein
VRGGDSCDRRVNATGVLPAFGVARYENCGEFGRVTSKHFEELFGEEEEENDKTDAMLQSCLTQPEIARVKEKKRKKQALVDSMTDAEKAIYEADVARVQQQMKIEQARVWTDADWNVARWDEI